MNDDSHGELPGVPADSGGLEEETAPPVDESMQSGAIPIKRSLNDLEAAEEARSSPAVQFTPKPPQPHTPGVVPPSADQSGQMRPASASSSFDAIVNPASASGSYDQIPQASASGSFDQMPASSPYHRPVQPASEQKQEDNRPPMGFMKRTFITLLVGIVAFVVVAYLCVSQWVPAQTALLLMGGGMALPTLLAGYFTSQRSKRNIVLRLFPALIFAGAGVAGAYMWSDAHIRAQAVPYTPATIKGMKMMLSDPSHEIALAGCERFSVKHDDPDWWSVMFELLNERPKLALDCIATMPTESKTKVGGSLADRWAGELVKGETKDPKRACMIAQGVGTLPIPPQEAGARLLQCSVEAEAPEIQGCCAEALAAMVEDENDWASRLPTVVTTAKSPAVRSGVLAMSLHGQGLTEPQKKLVEDIGFTSSPVRHVTLVLACESVTDENSPSIAHLKAALDTHCKLDMERMPKGSQWAKVCRNSLEKIKAEPTADPMRILCDITTVKPVAEAIAAAQTAVTKARPIITK